MDKDLFQKFKSIAYDRAGILLNDGKATLVQARIGKRMRALKMASERAYLDHLEADASGEELVHFLDAISTNFTSFYRESEHFEIFANFVKRKISAGQRRFRFWCAASSTGEEPYTILITLAEAFGNKKIDSKLLATDISTKVLKTAMQGEYTAERVTPVNAQQRGKYFSKRGRGDEAMFQVNDDLRQQVVFKRLNLNTPPFPMTGPLDAIFCRNVMIYFDRAVRQRLVSEMERIMADDAMLFIGHSETLAGIQSGLKLMKPSVYSMDHGARGHAHV